METCLKPGLVAIIASSNLTEKFCLDETCLYTSFRCRVIAIGEIAATKLSLAAMMARKCAAMCGRM